MNDKLTLKKVFNHFNRINKHRFLVFKLSLKAGIPFLGIIHDLSKYSFVEFFESARYYDGNYSPISNAKKHKGYSKAWLHHKGRNKHHFEYWYDMHITTQPIIPYKYFVEMVCDTLAAGMTYQGKNWTKEYQLSYWLRQVNTWKEKGEVRINSKIMNLLTKIYEDISVNGLEVINSKYLKMMYNKYVGE